MSGPDCQTLVVPLLDRNVLLPVNLRITLQVDLEFKISYRALFLQCRETILLALESTILSVNTNRKRPCQKKLFWCSDCSAMCEVQTKGMWHWDGIVLYTPLMLWVLLLMGAALAVRLSCMNGTGNPRLLR